MIPHEHWWSESQSYVSEILSVLAAAPDRPAAYWRGEATSGGDLIRSVTETFHALRNCRVGKGDVVAILVAPNSPHGAVRDTSARRCRLLLTVH
jgi:fatty-acyl-CoA synthase